MASASTCNGPLCDRPTKARGLCLSHYQQLRRGAPLTELGLPSKARAKRPALGVKVNLATLAKLQAKGKPSTVAGKVLDAWARAADD